MATPDEVDLLVNDDSLTDAAKLDRLYLEVRYARDTTLSLPKSSSLSRLKEKYKKLALETYRLNLKVYLSTVSSASFTTWDDFDNAMLQLQNAMCYSIIIIIIELLNYSQIKDIITTILFNLFLQHILLLITG